MKEAQERRYLEERGGHLSLAQLREQATERKRRMRVPALVPRERGRILPLSYAQEQLWFLDQLGLVGTAYNATLALRLDGALNVEALERSFAEVIRRHESLRTHFESVGGSPIQVVDPLGSFALEIHDLSRLDEEEKSSQLKRMSAAQARRVFDLSKGPLLHAALLQLAPLEHVLLVTMHHIVCDGWSKAILTRELCTLYRAYAQGQLSPLPALPVQYADYAIWQREWLHDTVLKEHLEYWRNQLAGAPPALELPADRPRPGVASFRGALLQFELSNALSDALKQLARREGATLFMVVLAAYYVLLWRYSGQQDVVVGSGIAGRTNAQTEGLIGLFVNMLVLRTDLSGNPSFREILRRVREVTLAAYAHQALPFEKLVKELRPDRDLARQPIFQVALELQNVPSEHMEMPGLIGTTMDVEYATALFDLTLYLSESPRGLSGTFEYATDLFDRDTIERLVGHFRVLLESVLANPDRPIEQLQLLTEADRKQVLQQFNDTGAAYPADRLIHELVQEQALRTPDAVAVACGDQQLTYRELDGRANQLARYLRRRGVGPDKLVAVGVERSLDMVVGLLGTLKAGGAYVPLDLSYPAERLAYMLRDSAPAVLLTRDGLRRTLRAGDACVIALDADWAEISREADDNLDPAQVGAEPKHLMYVIYTSGSTGTPKGVMVEHRNLVNLIHWHCAAFDVDAGSRCSSLSAVGFDATVWEIWPALCVGATVLLAPPQASSDPEALLTWWASQAVDVTFLSTPLAEFAFSRNLLNPMFRVLLVGGDRLRQNPSPKSFSLINNYGPTETTVIATSGRIFDGDTVLHIGRPLANTHIYILDPARQPVPIGVSGEIYIAGAGVARGYLNRPELTEQRFVSNPFSPASSARMYRTGDIARWRPDGTIEFMGRNDDQVKIRGNRIELGEIEAQLLKHSRVKEAVVLAREDGPGEKRLVAYVVADLPHRSSQRLEAAALIENSARQNLITQLRGYLRDHLPSYMVPSEWIVMEQMPLTPNGKVDRRALPASQGRSREISGYVAPRTELERSLADIWAQVLRVDRVGIEDNFFELGGHSLLATQAAVHIRDALSIEMSTRLLFERPTIAQLAERLGETRHARLLDKISDGGDDIDALLERVASMPECEVRALVRQLQKERS